MDIRYHIIPDEASHRVMIFDSETGAIQHPACWQDIAAYHNYLVDRGRMHEAQNLLAESMAGRKPITNMVANAANLPVKRNSIVRRPGL
ncbi:MAG TPA: hypothetical protein PLK99_06610 [Burkholderiales bacterium]|nr:hypothetical protein [Burkholderiales bacterium]